MKISSSARKIFSRLRLNRLLVAYVHQCLPKIYDIRPTAVTHTHPAKKRKKNLRPKTPQQNAVFCWEQHHFWGRHCSRWISRCLTTKALASVWDDMCWPKSRSIFRGRRGCQHPLGLRVTDGPNHTERHGHIHPEHALMYHLAFPKMELTSYQPYQKNSQSL